MTENIAMINALIGVFLIPPVLEFFKRERWSTNTQRLIALASCGVLAVAQAFLLDQDTKAMLINLPLLFAAATTGYHTLFEGRLGPLTLADPLKKLLGE